MMPKNMILITDPLTDEAIEILRRGGYEVRIIAGIDHRELVSEIMGYEAIIVKGRTEVDREVIERGRELKVIGRCGIGMDKIDIKAASERGIVVVNSGPVSASSVAELTIGHMISLSRSLPSSDMSVRRGEWERKRFEGREMMGKTLGLIGCGRIGSEVGRLARGFGMRVIAYDPYARSIPDFVEWIGDLKDLLSISDYVTIHVPLSDETYHLIDENALKEMKPTAYLINCSRGGIIDENALYDAIKDGKIAGAALDVFEKEPPGESPLLKLEHAFFTPHLGGITREGQERTARTVAEQVLKALKGEEPEYRVRV
jgi:D-3-phosphoglycerate dehydrogenase